MGKKKGPLDKVVPPRQRYCPVHGVAAKAVRVGVGKGRVMWDCPKGCRLTRAQAVVR